MMEKRHSLIMPDGDWRVTLFGARNDNLSWNKVVNPAVAAQGVGWDCSVSLAKLKFA